MTADTRLLIVDPQNDFCDFSERDLPAGCLPALPVPGAHPDLRRLARALSAHPQRVSHLAVTLDTHHAYDIAHPGYWLTGDGQPVAPFTPISAQAVRTGAFRTRREEDAGRAQRYLDALQAAGRYELMIWPVHCVDGHWGHHVHDEVGAACAVWAQQAASEVFTLRKGLNPHTEHYSALMAEVPDPQDPATGLNRELLNWVEQADALWVAGQASSHCVRATVEHLVAYLPQDFASRMTLLTDCMSPVAGFEAQSEAFLADMQARGAQLASVRERLG